MSHTSPNAYIPSFGPLRGLFLPTVWGCGSLIRVPIQLACLFSSDLITIKQLPESISDLVQGLLDVLSFQAEAELQEHYFEPLVKKEQIEEKMRNTREVKCRVVTCRTVSAGDSSPHDLSGVAVTQQDVESLWGVGPHLMTRVLPGPFN